MKKLTAGIFTVLMALVSANGANAAIATQGYVDQEVGKVSTDLSNNYSTTTQMNDAIATAKSGAEGTAAADATEKANKALDDAKTYVDGKLGALSQGAISETQNRVTANEQAIEGLLDTVADMDEAYKAADQTLQGNINTLSGTVSGMDAAYKAADTQIRTDFAAADATTLEDAKKYADEEDQKIETTIGTVETGKTVVQMIGEAKAAASSGASEALEAYKATNDAAVKVADDKAVAAQGEVDALEILVGNNKTATDAAIENITKENGTIDTKVAASAAATKTAYEAADASLKSDLEGQIAEANTAAGDAETNAKAYALEKANAALTEAVDYTDTVIANMNLSDISRVPAACADTTNYCSLTTNGTNFFWEVIKRADGETVTSAPVKLTEAAVTTKPETLK